VVLGFSRFPGITFVADKGIEVKIKVFFGREKREKV